MAFPRRNWFRVAGAVPRSVDANTGRSSTPAFVAERYSVPSVDVFVLDPLWTTSARVAQLPGLRRSP